MLILSGYGDTECKQKCESGYVEISENCLTKTAKPAQATKPTQIIKPTQFTEQTDSLQDIIKHQLKEIDGQRLRIDPYIAPYGEATIKIGNKSADVTTLQNLLKTKGYFTGSISGTFDTTTKDAVISFQKASGLIADGIAGPQTWSALTGKVSEEVDLRGIVSRYSGGLIPEYVDFFGTKIPTLYLGIGIGSLIGFAIYKRMQKRGEFETVLS